MAWNVFGLVLTQKRRRIDPSSLSLYKKAIESPGNSSPSNFSYAIHSTSLSFYRYLTAHSHISCRFKRSTVKRLCLVPPLSPRARFGNALRKRSSEFKKARDVRLFFCFFFFFSPHSQQSPQHNVESFHFIAAGFAPLHEAVGFIIWSLEEFRCGSSCGHVTEDCENIRIGDEEG